MRFDSKKEARRWVELFNRQAVGAIHSLRRQVRYPIDVNGFRVCVYVADATYVEGGRLIVEDVKSPMTRKLPAYRLKRKLMAAVFGITIREV